MNATATLFDIVKAWVEGVASAQGGIEAGTLTIHADRGSPMTSKPVAVLLADLKIGRTHSRPQVSNDNPFPEAGFKALKYCPDFPERFGSLADARAFAAMFFERYNHHHSGIGLHTPASVHFGTAADVRAARTKVLDAAYAAHPERFVNQAPIPPPLPGATWINKPKPTEDETQRRRCRPAVRTRLAKPRSRRVDGRHRLGAPRSARPEPRRSAALSPAEGFTGRAPPRHASVAWRSPRHVHVGRA